MNDDVVIDISDRHSTHVMRFVHDLSSHGWTPAIVPAEGKLLPNRQLIELREPHGAIFIRVSIYKVGDRGEPHRLDERRIEITTTFASGLSRLRSWTDVLLGYDFENDVYVGLDPRRLSLGGETHNASSSVDPSALVAAPRSRILIRPHETPSLGVEYQAIFRPPHLAEYLFNYRSIHDGLYLGEGLFSGAGQRTRELKSWMIPRSDCKGTHLVLTHAQPVKSKRRKVSSALVQAYETQEIAGLRDVSPEELDRILRKCREVGDGGEHFVYQYERKRLHKAGRGGLANRIEWISQKSVAKGYDIRSFEIDGTPRNIEVKATIGKSSTFFMSSYEWKIASKMRKSYWVYRVIRALDGPRIASQLQDPVGAEGASKITRVPDGWRITIL